MKSVLLFHDEMLNPEHPLLALYPDIPRVFIFDTAQLERDGFSLQRVQFIADCAVEIPGVQVFKGLTKDILIGLNAEMIITQKTPQLHVSSSLSSFKVQWHDEPEFVSFRGKLKRFMHYWKAVEPKLIGASQLQESMSTQQSVPSEQPQLNITFEDAA